jgi:hypothetical protein
MPLQEIAKKRESFQNLKPEERADKPDDPCLDKKVCTIDVTFEVTSNDTNLQSEQATEQLKYVLLL